MKNIPASKIASAFYFFFCVKLLWQSRPKPVKNEKGLARK
jgi:hypothetical protein